jgi:hypothetical protein
MYWAFGKNAVIRIRRIRGGMIGIVDELTS